jgi:hypothetical protein
LAAEVRGALDGDFMRLIAVLLDQQPVPLVG